MSVLHINIFGGNDGNWIVTKMKTITGEPMPLVSHLYVTPATYTLPVNFIWQLKGFASNVRYSTADEKRALEIVQAGLGRTEATTAVLIPIRKMAAWWTMAQDERRKIFEEQSHHTEIGKQFLPAIARKLYHARDLDEPFDFLTWFEFAPEHEEAFSNLLQLLRATREWQYVDREIEIWLKRPSAK